MVHDLKPKNLHSNGLIFFAKSKKPYFGCVFGHYPQNEIIPQNSNSFSFLPLRHPNFKGSFRNILSCFGENTFTYRHTDSGDIIGPPFALCGHYTIHLIELDFLKPTSCVM